MLKTFQRFQCHPHVPETGCFDKSRNILVDLKNAEFNDFEEVTYCDFINSDTAGRSEIFLFVYLYLRSEEQNLFDSGSIF